MRGEYDRDLFRKQSFHDAESEAFQRNGAVDSATNKIPKDQFLTTPDVNLVEHIYSDLYKDPLVLHEDRLTRTYTDENIEVQKVVQPPFESHPIHVRSQGCSIAVSIPFTGDIKLWGLTPNPYLTVSPEGEVHAPKGGHPGKLVLTFLYPLDGLEEKVVRNDIDREIDSSNLLPRFAA